MMETLSREKERFVRLNRCAQKGGVVFLGSTYWAQMPVSELAQDFPVDVPVYNRSVEGLRLSDAEPMLEVVCALEPSRIFVGLGDADLESGDFEIGRFLAAYEWLLYTLHGRCRGQICMLSVASKDARTGSVNEALRRLAAETGCAFVDITAAQQSEQREMRAFESVKRHFMRQTPRFADVFFSLS